MLNGNSLLLSLLQSPVPTPIPLADLIGPTDETPLKDWGLVLTVNGPVADTASARFCGLKPGTFYYTIIAPGRNMNWRETEFATRAAAQSAGDAKMRFLRQRVDAAHYAVAAE